MTSVPFNVTVDNISPLIQYAPAGAWREGSASNDNLASSYSNGGTFTLCTTQGSSASLTFNGTQVYVFGAKRPNHGPYSVTLDGTSSTFDGFSSPEFFGPLFVSSVLKPGQHTVTITNQLTDAARPFLDIDFITWTTTSDQNGASNTLEDTSSNFAFSPASSWSTDLVSNKLTGFSGNNGHVTLSAGATAALTFTGERVAVFGPIGPTISPYIVQLDGQPAGTFNATKQNYVAQTTLFAANGLGSGQHILEIIPKPTVAGQILGIDFAQVAANFGGSSSSATSKKPTQSGGGGIGGGGANSANQSSSSKSEVGPAVGGAIAGIVVLAVLGFLIFFVVRRKKRLRDEEAINGNGLYGGDKYGPAGAPSAPSQNYTMSTMHSSGGPQESYHSQNSQAQLIGSHQHQASLSYQPSMHSSVYSAPMLDPWNRPQIIATPVPPVPDTRRGFYAVNDSVATSPTSEDDGASSLGRTSTVNSAGAAGLGAGAYRRKGDPLPLPPTANLPLPPGTSRMQVPGREQDFGPVNSDFAPLPPSYIQATEPARSTENQTYYSGSSVTSDPYGGYVSEAGSPTRTQYSQGHR
ncbi:hypothetical protein MIND_00952000 [Mycena indigotica]|uniref:Transmembrane protein n=1 Tax=Mycena indigotica TaxID=2126181 RepID=A0A8H6W2Q2_9AGAR|nr:uncharacterized protein MIND_00952000 [Mycena indigotica]KAF7297189.1 hypothetical protein MIND_00952000 [Mycena indigotica]